jgi:hypothetical protein
MALTAACDHRIDYICNFLTEHLYSFVSKEFSHLDINRFFFLSIGAEQVNKSRALQKVAAAGMHKQKSRTNGNGVSAFTN